MARIARPARRRRSAAPPRRKTPCRCGHAQRQMLLGRRPGASPRPVPSRRWAHRIGPDNRPEPRGMSPAMTPKSRAPLQRRARGASSTSAAVSSHDSPAERPPRKALRRAAAAHGGAQQYDAPRRQAAGRVPTPAPRARSRRTRGSPGRPCCERPGAPCPPGSSPEYPPSARALALTSALTDA